jgi:CHAD domain-containing protein
MKEREIVETIEESFKTLDKLCHKILKEFDADDIHDFRVEVKKLRAFLRLLDIKKEEDGSVIPKLLKTFYGHVGVIRNIQLSEQSLSKYITAHPGKNPEEYLKLLHDEKNYWEKEADKLMEDNNFHNVKKEIIKKLPESLDKSSIEKFVHHKLTDLKKYLKDLSGDDALHSIRKGLKDLLYTWDYIKNHADLPKAISGKEKLLKSFTITLGNFIDESMRLEFLQPLYLDKIKDDDEKSLLQKVEKEWGQEKRAHKRKLRRSLNSLQKRLSAVKYQTNNTDT